MIPARRALSEPGPVIPGRAVRNHGFSLLEFMIAALVFLVLAGGLFEIVGRVQRVAGYQPEVQGVLENTRIAMERLERIFEQAGNDPAGSGFPALVIASAVEVRVCADLTGSAGPGSPDKGDPDGDVDDANEDLTIRYDAGTQTLYLAAGGGAAQPIANNLTAFALQYFDCNGVQTMNGTDVCRVRIQMEGTSPLPDPQTGRIFSMELSGDFLLAARR